jgi:hypothetical protein
VALSGLIAGAIDLLLMGSTRGLYLESRFREAIERVNPALMENVTNNPARGIGFLTIQLLLGVAAMYTYAAMRPRFDRRLAAVVSAALAVSAVRSLNWGIVSLIGIFSWQHVAVESMMRLGVGLLAIYVGSLVYKDAPA